MQCSYGVSTSRHRRSTLLPERSKLFKSHWSNQWLTSKIELGLVVVEQHVVEQLA